MTAAATVLNDTAGRFARDYNRVSFAFDHGLPAEGLFTVAGLLALSGRLPQTRDFVYWSSAAIGVGDRWETGADVDRSLEETIRTIDRSNALVMLRHLERDPVAGPVITAIVARLFDLCGAALRDDATTARGTILLASPRRLTSYHIDADTNFLLQIAGDKTLHVFNHDDRTLLTDEELERYCSGDFNGAAFKPARQAAACHYELGPGCGLHIPATAPHWACNHDSVSIALSVNFDLRSMQRRIRIHRWNGRLRRLGLEPRPPGASSWRDGAKHFGERTIEHLRGRAPPS